MSIGSRIKELREYRKITRKDLAQEIGVTQAQIGHYETGHSSPSMDLIVKIAEILGCDFNYIFQDEIKTPPSNFTASPTEIDIIEKMRHLSSSDKGLIVNLIDGLYNQRLTFEEENLDRVTLLPTILNANEPNVKSYFVTGNAMFPIFKDGEVVLAEDTKILKEGETGIFKIKDKLIMRRFEVDHLEASKVDFKDIKLNKRSKVEIIGKVICKV